MTKVLIIEDEDGLRENIRTLLNEEGYDVIATDNGFNGLELSKSFSPDIIICDIMMRGMNGYEVLQSLIADDRTKRIPFIFLSARVEREHIRMGMELGADDYLLKPFMAKELLTSIEARLKKSLLYKESDPDKKPNEKFVGKELYSLNDKIFIKQRDDIGFIKVIDITFIKSANQYSEVFTDNGKSFLLHKSLKEWENKLPEKNFIRIHREIIICIDKIIKMEKWFNSSYRIYLTGVSKPFSISTRNAKKVRLEL